MEFTRVSRKKSFLKKSNHVGTEKRIPVVFDLKTLDIFFAFCLSENRYLRNSNLISLRNLINLLDMSLYKNDPEKMRRITWICRVLDARIVMNIKNRDILAKHVNGGILEEDQFNPDQVPVLSTDDLNWVNETVASTLKYAFLYSDVDRMIDICTRFKTSDFKTREDIVKEYEEAIFYNAANLRRAKVESMQEMTFSLKNNFDDNVTDIYNQVTSPSRRLICEMQGINEMTGGGFESGRVYILLGITGVGKSLSMLNLMTQMKRANCDYQLKDPTRTPCIVLLTMENTVTETITRLFDMVTTGTDMKDYSIEDVIRMLKEEGELSVTGDNPIDLIIKYMPNRSVDTGYLYTICDDLEDQGYEVICMFQDHLKRIRSQFPQTDLRIELGEVVNEMKVFCSIKDIPLITDSHLNRDAVATIDAAARSNKADLTRMLGKANVGESMLILDNADCAFIINKDYDVDNNCYLAFLRVKMRDKCTPMSYIAQPFERDNSAKLMTDLYGPPVYKTTLQKAVYNPTGTAIPTNKSLYKSADDINAFEMVATYSVDSAPIMTEMKPEDSFIPATAGGVIAPKFNFPDGGEIKPTGLLDEVEELLNGKKKDIIVGEPICPIEFIV